MLKRFESLETQVLGVSVDTIPCHQAWQRSLGGIEFPLLSDFWPHGKTAKDYGVLTDAGYAERVVVIIDREGIIRYIDEVGMENLPDNDLALSRLEQLG